MIKFSENQSAPKLENRKTSPFSPCAPNLLHVLVSRIPGYHNFCSPALTFVLLICSEIEKERRNMVILPPTNISGIFECEWNEGKGWNFHLNLIWIWKKWGKIPNSFIPQLPLTTGRSSKKMIKNFHDICHLADPPPYLHPFYPFFLCNWILNAWNGCYTFLPNSNIFSHIHSHLT